MGILLAKNLLFKKVQTLKIGAKTTKPPWVLGQL